MPDARDAGVGFFYASHYEHNIRRPASIYDATTKTTTLPSVQKHGDFSINPMVAVSGNPELSFKNVCAVLAIKIDSEDIDLVKSIRVSSANCATSGEFTIERTDEGYKAVLKDPEDVKQVVVLDCGEGVKPSVEGTVFHVAIPAQVYKSLKIELSEDGETYTKQMTTKGEEGREVFENKIYDITFKADPIILLPGKFTVSSTGKQVQFTKGNLWCNTTASPVEWHLESAQNVTYSTLGQSAYDATHVCNFYWSKTASAAFAETFSDEGRATEDKFFCGEDNKLTVDGQSDLYALSTDEWVYLFQTRTNASSLYNKGVSVTTSAGTVTKCIVIAPDGYTGTIALSYSAEEWAIAESNGLVCLPAVGYRDDLGLYYAGSFGLYWSSTPGEVNKDGAHYLTFGGSGVTLSNCLTRYSACSIRLVCSVPE